MPCPRISLSALMSGLRHASNSRVDSHVSAYGMPDGARVMSSACGWPRTRPWSPSWLPPGGTEVLLQSLAPAREGSGVMRWGQRRPIAPENQRQPLGVTKRPCWSVVGRLLDTFDKDASGVAAPQHSARSIIPLRGPTERSESGTGDLGARSGSEPNLSRKSHSRRTIR